ncbi:MAG: hypothetical protein IJY28_09190 [Clostridia bacterium]|nr:hypothetical protein [Clostridia bacterium]
MQKANEQINKRCPLPDAEFFGMLNKTEEEILANQESIRAKFEEYKAFWEEREQNVLSLRLGLADGQPHTREEVARMLQVSPVDVYQMERKARWELREQTQHKLPLADILAKAGVYMPEEADQSPEYAERLAEFEETARKFRWTEREQAVMYLQLGVADGRRRTLEEVAQKFQLSREQIMRLEHVAFTRRVCHMRWKRLADYLDD